MNSVVTGGVQYQLQRAQVGHQLSVDPELVQQVQLLVDHSMAGRDEEGQGNIEWLQKDVMQLLNSKKILPMIQKFEKLTV